MGNGASTKGKNSRIANQVKPILKQVEKHFDANSFIDVMLIDPTDTKRPVVVSHGQQNPASPTEEKDTIALTEKFMQMVAAFGSTITCGSPSIIQMVRGDHICVCAPVCDPYFLVLWVELDVVKNEGTEGIDTAPLRGIADEISKVIQAEKKEGT